MRTVVIYSHTPGEGWSERFRKENITVELMHRMIDEAFRIYGEGIVIKIY